MLKNHAKSKHHKDKLKTVCFHQPTIKAFASTSASTQKTNAKTAEVKLAGFFAEHNIAFTVADHLCNLLKECFPDSNIAQDMNFKRMKMTKIVGNVIGSSHKANLADTLQHTKFSVLTDESTDISSVKISCIVVRYLDESTTKMCSKFWELHPIFSNCNCNVGGGKNVPTILSKDDAKTANEGAPGKNIFEGIMESFRKYSIPTDNIVGFASDGCNVMMGSKNSVSSRFSEEMPGIIVIRCMSFSSSLCQRSM